MKTRCKQEDCRHVLHDTDRNSPITAKILRDVNGDYIPCSACGGKNYMEVVYAAKGKPTISQIKRYEKP